MPGPLCDGAGRAPRTGTPSKRGLNGAGGTPGTGTAAYGGVRTPRVRRDCAALPQPRPLCNGDRVAKGSGALRECHGRANPACTRVITDLCTAGERDPCLTEEIRASCVYIVGKEAPA